ncbi:pyruvate formate lyase-activating protein [Dactylosporangium roseum]|uniref:Pyruvate formate-lyase-activating enzyme n=1 Tax=Dactylosporangium roseum TaxID=47989 RepID=A0ABY5Z085_9ACTN|nr:pyruvate formate-lyase-activating protein [Dactylosporangium roseum]UWZ33899.1 pyruvate formate lyase-activating protein [Dactylosporangium roseum]
MSVSEPLVVPGGGTARPRATNDAPAWWRAVPGRLHSWDVSTGVDGPGTRFVAFLAGCPLRCLYCQNPDTWRMRDGTRTTAGVIIDRAADFVAFVRTAGGGLTVSGGEPLLQAAFTTALFTGARELGLHTALDTSGALGARATDALLAATDLVLLDIKAWDPDRYRRLTGGSVDPTLRFARRLAARGTPVWIRYVLVPGLTDDPAEVDGVAGFAAGLGNVERVDVLPFHRLGVAKYDRLGIPFRLRDTAPPDRDLLDQVRARFAAHGLAAY